VNKTQQLSIASLLLTGIFVSGCSQQQVQEPIEPTPQPTPVIMVDPPKPTPAPVVQQPAPVKQVPTPVVRPKSVNPNCHSHPANAMSKSVKHCHKNPQGKHHYGNRMTNKTPVAPMKKMPVAPAKPRIDVQALQRKLKSKGYYKGPIDGVVGDGTRDALQRFQNR
jgi:hypothetical protein